MRRRDDDDEVVRDGSSVRVPLMLCDGEVMMLPPWQRDVMLSLRYQMSDAEAARHRPGFRFADAAANRAKAKAYDDSVVEASNAWRGPQKPRAAAPSRPVRRARPGGQGRGLPPNGRGLEQCVAPARA